MAQVWSSGAGQASLLRRVSGLSMLSLLIDEFRLPQSVTASGQFNCLHGNWVPLKLVSKDNKAEVHGIFYNLTLEVI